MSRGGGGWASNLVDQLVGTEEGREIAYQLLDRFLAELDAPAAADGERLDDDFGWMIQLRHGLLHLWRDTLSEKDAYQHAEERAGRRAGDIWDLLLLISKRIRVMQSVPTRRLRPLPANASAGDVATVGEMQPDRGPRS